nr:7-deoxyloganetic acid glucosyltransferase-like [Ziziphus jujuba var. spinosa]
MKTGDHRNEHPFLWAIRPDVVLEGGGENEVIPEELEMGAKENGYVVDWAPQEKVQAHSSIGGFLTHRGWNSISESVMARVPLICYLDRNDQNINSQLLSKVLRIGIELEACDRSTIETTVRTLMGSQREEFQKSVDKIARCARDGIGLGGSSSRNFEILLKDIEEIKQKNCGGKNLPHFLLTMLMPNN